MLNPVPWGPVASAGGPPPCRGPSLSPFHSFRAEHQKWVVGAWSQAGELRGQGVSRKAAEGQGSPEEELWLQVRGSRWEMASECAGPWAGEEGLTEGGRGASGEWLLPGSLAKANLFSGGVPGLSVFFRADLGFLNVIYTEAQNK